MQREGQCHRCRQELTPCPKCHVKVCMRCSTTCICDLDRIAEHDADRAAASYGAASAESGSARECNCLQAKTASRALTSKRVMIMLDGGSNTNMAATMPSLLQHATVTSTAPESITGVWQQSGNVVNKAAELDLVVAGANDGADVEVRGIRMLISQHARRNILSESSMWDTHRWRVLKEPVMRVDTPGGSLKLERINGLYFVYGSSIAQQAQSATAQRECSALTVRTAGKEVVTRMWSARMHVTGEGLRAMQRNTLGTGLDAVDQVMVQTADQDTFVKRSNQRRVPVSSTPVGDKAEMPGERMILDVFTSPSQSVVDGAIFEFSAVCEVTSVGYESARRQHTKSDWLWFVDHIIAEEHAIEHAPRFIRIDAEPTCARSDLKQIIEAKHGVVVEFAAGGHHEGVAAAEVRNDVKQRIAEGMLMRCEKPVGFLLRARGYAGQILNRRAANKRSLTRLEHHTGRKVDLSSPVPYLFGIEVSCLNDEPVRGPKGAGCHPESSHKGRTSVGLYMGFNSKGIYLVLMPGGALVERSNVTPLNELVLMRRGVPSGAITVDSAVQTEDQPNAPAMRQPSAPFPKPTAFEAYAPPDMIGPPATRTRQQQAKASAAINAIEAQLEHVPLGQLVETFNAAVYQFLPAAADVCHCERVTDLSSMRSLLSSGAQQIAAQGRLECSHLEISKATSDKVQFLTDLGMQEFHTPGSFRQREAAVDSEEWKEADEKALEVLLRAGNKLVSIEKPRRLGVPVVDGVLQRRYKVDPASRRLEKRKSRLCYDEPRAKAAYDARGLVREREAHAENADDMLIKMFIANAAARKGRPRRRLLKADVGNAYCKGRRARPAAYMGLGKALARTNDAGVPMCLEVVTPIYGEGPAGDEWDTEATEASAAAGWMAAEGVPALSVAKLAGGTSAEMIRIVDDFLVAVPAERKDVGDAFIKFLRERYDDDVTWEWDPTSFGGYAIVPGPEGETFSLLMTKHIEHTALQHEPGIIDGSDLPSKRLAKGESLQSIADALVHQSATGQLNAEQKQVQAITGGLRYPEKVLPMLTLPLHRLSCVGQAPPPQARLLAGLVIELAYQHRHEGLTYGGAESSPRAEAKMSANIDLEGRPPEDLEATADATWTAGLGAGDDTDVVLPPLSSLASHNADGEELVAHDLYGILLTYNGAAVFHQTKKIGVLLDSVQAGEGVASNKASEVLMYGREIERAFTGVEQSPTILGTDNKSNMQISMRRGAANRSKHMLRRYHVLMKRIRGKHLRVVHVPGEENPSDFLTKFLPAAKLRASLSYAMGQLGRPKGYLRSAVAQRRAA